MAPPVYEDPRPPLLRKGEPTELRRVVDHPEGQESILLRRIEGAWYEDLDGDTWTRGRVIPFPGARDFTVAEFAAGHIRRTKRYGEWVEVSNEAARAAEQFLSWCRRWCNSELPAGGFRFPPLVWAEREQDRLDLPFLPEFDDPDQVLRGLASAERMRRRFEADLEDATTWRREALAEAARAGHSRRALAGLVGLSFARVQQLVAEVEKGSGVP